MKATKFTVEIKIEVLSMDSIWGVFKSIADNLARGDTYAEIIHDDGDSYTVDVTSEALEF